MMPDKSIHELRSIAEGYGIPNLFAMTKDKLLQEILLRQDAAVPKPPLPEPDPVPAEAFGDRENEISAILKPYTALGMSLSFFDCTWIIKHNKREDSGHTSCGNDAIIKAAQVVMR